MATNQPSIFTSRRAILGAALAIPALGIASSAAAAPIAVDRSAWDHAFAAVEHARLADEVYDPIYMRAYAAYADEIPSPDSVKWRFTSMPYVNRAHVLNVLDLDEYERNFLAQEGKTWRGENIKAATLEDINAVRDYRRQCADANERHNLTAIEAEWERVGDVYYQAKWALFELPAPDRDALLWKAEHLFGESTSVGNSCSAWSAEIIATYMEDTRRILSMEA